MTVHPALSRDYTGNLHSSMTLGVSACLLGQKVRYDGGHQHERYLTDTLGQYFRLLPVCPEVECGLPVPREAMRLEGTPQAPQLLTRSSRRNLTEQMLGWCRQRVAELQQEELCGFVFKKDSPSSGLYRVKVYASAGMPAKTGSGLFAAAVARSFPLLPLEEEGRLHDPALRENFIERVFALGRWQQLLRQQPQRNELVVFHTRHKLQLLAHSPVLYRALGALVAQIATLPLTEVLRQYEREFMTALASHATVSKNVNVLQHIMGYFKKVLTAAEKQELLGVIGDYQRQLVPLVVPLTLLKHYVAKYQQVYLQQQTYLSPHPAELMLRNHV